MHDLLEQHASEQLRELGLIHKYPLHIDVVNNENGFALYMKNYNDDTAIYYLRIREVGDDGALGEWHNMDLFEGEEFAENLNPPAALERAGFGYFDHVTWLTGLEENSTYQVQVWEEYGDPNGRLEPNSRLEPYFSYSSDEDGNVVRTVEGYDQVEGEPYSGIHNINTDPDAFNVDINGDGAMDYFIS